MNRGILLISYYGSIHTGPCRQDDGEGRSGIAILSADGRLLVSMREQQQGLLGPGELVEGLHELSQELPSEATSLLLNRSVRRLLVGLADGRIAEWKLGSVRNRPQYVGTFKASDESITALNYILVMCQSQ